MISKLAFQIKLHVKCLLTAMQKVKAEQFILTDPEASSIVDWRLIRAEKSLVNLESRAPATSL